MGTKKICDKSIALLLGFCWVSLTEITAANAGASVDVALGKGHAFTLDLFLPFDKGEIGDGATEGISLAKKVIRQGEHR